ncbi:MULTISPECIES: hypothetical protein [unclassified Nostoc]|uniref:hypothetical protein n=1 Tax=unclassified Nostoc TaxID=2593658 RepID=UPI002AD291C8|nr:hypothetical protein [Nostoc sp. DedQUE03]
MRRFNSAFNRNDINLQVAVIEPGGGKKMFELNDLRQTRFFQDVFEEGKKEGKREVFEEGNLEAKLEMIPHLLGFGLSIEQIAQALGLDEQVVRQAAQPKS